jgi:hypothetical protein
MYSFGTFAPAQAIFLPEIGQPKRHTPVPKWPSRLVPEVLHIQGEPDIPPELIRNNSGELYKNERNYKKNSAALSGVRL